MTDESIQTVVEDVDEYLQEALELANTYVENDEVRPSAVMAFKAVDDARERLDAIDEREFVADE